MTSNSDAMSVLEAAISKARRQAPMQPEAPNYDNWIAWIVANELRQQGWNILPPDNWHPA